MHAPTGITLLYLVLHLALPDLAIKKTTDKVKWGTNLYLKKKNYFFVYLKFRFNRASHILSGSLISPVYPESTELVQNKHSGETELRHNP